ncbi:MAG: hypothetical protein RR543_04820 [Erysipelotrichales bacterium]
MDFITILSFVIIRLVLPIAAIVALIYLTLLLKQLIVTTKKLDNLSVDLEHKLSRLDEPIDTVVSIADGFNKFSGVVSTAFTGLAGFTSIKNMKNKRSRRKKGGNKDEI